MRHLIGLMADASELERIYDEHAQALFAFLLNLTRNETDTRDLLQEIFVRIAREPNLFRGVRNQRSFLIRLAHNAAIDWMRRHGTRAAYQRRAGAELDSVFQASDDRDEEAFRRALETALAELPEEQRAVVHLKLWEELTFEEIANVLEIPANTAASRYRYGLDKMRERLRPLHDEIR